MTFFSRIRSFVSRFRQRRRGRPPNIIPVSIPFHQQLSSTPYIYNEMTFGHFPISPIPIDFQVQSSSTPIKKSIPLNLSLSPISRPKITRSLRLRRRLLAFDYQNQFHQEKLPSSSPAKIPTFSDSIVEL